MTIWQKLGLFAAICVLAWLAIADRSQGAAAFLFVVAFLFIWNWPARA